MPPSLFADVMEENLSLVEKIHLLDADYLRCVGPSHSPSSALLAVLCVCASNLSVAGQSGFGSAESELNPCQLVMHSVMGILHQRMVKPASNLRRYHRIRRFPASAHLSTLDVNR